MDAVVREVELRREWNAFKRKKGIAGWEVGIEGEGGLEDLICTDPANLGAAFFPGEIFWREMAFFLLKPKLWPGKCGGASIFWY